jgi:signal transduction histidine kinase
VQDRVSLTAAGSSGDFLRIVTPVTNGSREFAVCVIGSVDPMSRAQDAVLLALAVAFPLLVLAVCVVVWLAVGRALHAVEDMRAQADAMQSTSDGLLRIPDTGDEVEHLGHTLNGLLGRLHQQTRATRQFVADAGHELRNPLSTLRVTLEFGQDADDDDLRHSVREALADLDRLEALTQDLLVLARSDAQEGPPEAAPMDLADVAAEAVAASRRGNPQLTITVSTRQCTVIGDPAALRSLVSNLLDNAARHARSTVSADVRPEGDMAVLRVDDDGVGLSVDDCARVFERFVRLDAARDRDEGGSGLGLAIVSAIAEAHGGSALAEPGPGGHFLVRIPLARA